MTCCQPYKLAKTVWELGAFATSPVIQPSLLSKKTTNHPQPKTPEKEKKSWDFLSWWNIPMNGSRLKRESFNTYRLVLVISQVCPELPGVYGRAGDITHMGWPSLPWPLLKFPGAEVDHVGSSESHSAAALVCSEGAQIEQGNSQTPGKYLLDDAFRENKCWHKSSPHSCFYLLWLTFAWDWCRCSHFAHSCNVPFLASQFVPITRSLSVHRSTRVQAASRAGEELAALLGASSPPCSAAAFLLWDEGHTLLGAALHQISSEFQLFLVLYLASS